MKSIKELFNNVRERFTNPLFFSYILAWLVLNWKITIALLWFDKEQIRSTGCNNIFEYIQDYLGGNEVDYRTPVWVALGYTLIVPLVRICVSAFNVFVSKVGEQWNIKIVKASNVPTEKYLSLRADYEVRTKLLENMITAEDTSFKTLQTVRADLIKMQDEAHKLRLLNSNIEGQLNTKTKEIKELAQANISFKVIWARYGKYSKYEDVTKVVSEGVLSERGISATNEALLSGKDPIRDVIKLLDVVYQSNGTIKYLTATENQTVRLINNENLVAADTEESKKKSISLKNQPKLAEIFTGEWLLVYTKDKKIEEERVIIDDRGHYYRNGIFAFRLLFIDITDQKIKFHKRSLNYKTHSIEDLTRVTQDELTGYNNIGIQLHYSRVQQMPARTTA